MESCGLCFKLNDDAANRDLESRYVFPEFLQHEKPEHLTQRWQERTKDVQVLRYPLKWLNYYRIQAFIAALGRKTKRPDIWRNGIHIETSEGWFLVELDVVQKEIVLSIEKKAMHLWLSSILEALEETGQRHENWYWEAPEGLRVFAIEEWKKDQQPERLHARPDSFEMKQTLSEKMLDVEQKSIFFSYAWNDHGQTVGGREEVVNQLYDALKKDGFDARRDKNNLSYAGLITEFMKQIGKGDLVVVFMSHKYLKSPFCMWELYEVYRNSRAEKDLFIQRILPIRVENVNLNSLLLLDEI